MGFALSFLHEGLSPKLLTYYQPNSQETAATTVPRRPNSFHGLCPPAFPLRCALIEERSLNHLCDMFVTCAKRSLREFGSESDVSASATAGFFS